jgi:RHS repeat-associated protein
MVTLTVTGGPNAGVTRSGTTNMSGQVSLSYLSNSQTGTDMLTATGPFASCMATKTWQVTTQPDRVDNRAPTYNLVIDPVQKPSCGGCSDGSRTSFTAGECPKCSSVGNYLGVQQDSGGRTVYLHNGEFVTHEVDLEIPGRGFNWKFARSYRNGISFNGPLGHNWEFNYNRRLEVMPGGQVVRMDGFSRSDAYERTPDGSYRSPTGYYTGLVMNRDGTFVEREPNGTKIHYSRPAGNGLAVMTRLVDRNGNTMRFVYNAQNQLTRVLDTLGRAIDYSYNAQGRLVRVQDFLGRTIQFEYDTRGDLVSVTSPAVTGTPTRNDFPRGKTTEYDYSSGFANPVLNHNLLAITAPNEVASRGPARIQLVYETNTASPNLDRVLRQTIGGTNRPAEFANGQVRFRSDVRVPAGGTISYEYRFLGAVRPGDFNSAMTQTTVTDRNGNRTEYQFNQLGNIVRIREFTNRNIRAGDPEFYETRYEYSRDGELTRMVRPEGNSVEYVYDAQNPIRSQQGNLLAEIRRPDAKRGGDQASLQTSYSYEPIYNQQRTVTDPRGNDPSYLPQNGGANSAARYTTVSIFDYQEGDNFAALAQELGMSESAVRMLLQQANIPMGLGDVNGDGRTDQIVGHVVKVIYPTVTLLPDSHMARLEGSPRQPIEEQYVYNTFGQMVRKVDAEGNVTVYEYHPENDPDGDGRNPTPGVTSGPFGYLKAVIQDAESNAIRNSRTDPEPARIRRQYFYDRVGNVIKEINGRGVATEYVVNQLNQIVQSIRAADVSEALRNPEEPNFGGCTDTSLIECQAGMVAFRYLTNYFYDYNDNLIRLEIENRDSNNQALAGSFIEYTVAYDILDHRIEAASEVSETPRQVLVTRYRYDRNENEVLEISPIAVAGGQPSNVVSKVYDERDLLFTTTSGGVTAQFRTLAAHADIPGRTQIPNSAELSTFTRGYDLNRNLKQLIDAADNTGDRQPEATIYLYDGFDRQVSVIDAVGNQSFTNFDPVGNVVRESRFGPVGGPSPTNNQAATLTQPLTLQSIRQPLLSQSESKFDELRRVFERADRLFDYRSQGVNYARAPQLSDGPLGGANDGVVVARFEYDRKGRQVFTVADDLDTTETRYDGVDRVSEQIDPEGNRVRYTYDAKDNVVKIVQVELTSREAVGAAKVPDLTETFITINVYDSLDRLIRATSNVGQTRRNHYDSRDNLIMTSDAQSSSNPADLIPDPLGLFPSAGADSVRAALRGRPQAALLTTVVAEGHPLGDSSATIAGDSVGASVSGRPPWGWLEPSAGAHGEAPVQTSAGAVRAAVPGRPQWDLVRPPWGWSEPSAGAHGEAPVQAQSAMQINRPGNTMAYFYDGINRRITEVRELRRNGQGSQSLDTSNPANADGQVTLQTTWDANSRKTSRADDRGNTTRYDYDNLNRLVRETFADGTTNVHTYDADSNRLQTTDENRSVITRQYDGINRVTALTITRAAGLIGSTQQTFQYDGLRRLVRAVDNNDPADAADDAIVTLAYDSLNRRLEEVQNGQAISSRWSGDNIRVGLVYPNNRELGFTFDHLDRINQISDQPSAISHQPIVDYNYIGPDRVLERTYSNGARLTYLDDARQQDIGYDGLKRVVNLRHLRPDASLIAGLTYSYDRQNNKLSEQRLDQPSANERYTYDSLYRLTEFTPSAGSSDTFQLDGVGNWMKRNQAANQVNVMNEYEQVGGVAQRQDDNGNLSDDGRNRYEYDGLNRLRRVTRKSDNAVIAVYRYDAFNRRVERTVTNSGALNERVQYYYDGWREIEERRGTAVQQYVYGVWIDEPLTLDRDENADGVADQSFFYHQDGRTNVTALTDATGGLVQTITYDAYGRPSFGPSSVANPYSFAGRRYDPETGLYYYRTRYYDPVRGRFLQRDPIGIWTDEANLGNGYTYVGNNPLSWTDPLGLARPGRSFKGGCDASCGAGEYSCCRHREDGKATCACFTLVDLAILTEMGFYLGCENDMKGEPDCTAFDRKPGLTLPPCYYSPMGCWSLPTELFVPDGQISPLFPLQIRGGLLKEVFPPSSPPPPPPPLQGPGSSRCGKQDTSVILMRANNSALDCGTCEEGGAACTSTILDGTEYCSGLNCRTNCKGGKSVLSLPKSLVGAAQFSLSVK